MTSTARACRVPSPDSVGSPSCALGIFTLFWTHHGCNGKHSHGGPTSIVKVEHLRRRADLRASALLDLAPSVLDLHLLGSLRVNTLTLLATRFDLEWLLRFRFGRRLDARAMLLGLGDGTRRRRWAGRRNRVDRGGEHRDGTLLSLTQRLFEAGGRASARGDEFGERRRELSSAQVSKLPASTLSKSEGTHLKQLLASKCELGARGALVALLGERLELPRDDAGALEDVGRKLC